MRGGCTFWARSIGEEAVQLTLVKNAQEKATKTVCASGPICTYLPKTCQKHLSELRPTSTHADLVYPLCRPLPRLRPLRPEYTANNSTSRCRS
jgi:hypothetical protein